MRLDVLDADTLVRVGWVDVWVSFYWDSPYYSEGGFILEVRPTTENLQLLQEGRWVVRSDETPRIPMRICSRANQNADANLVVSGYPATWLLTKRVSAAVIKEQNAEQAMRGLVAAMKLWPRLELGTEYGFATTFSKQTSGGTVFDYCQTIGQACDLGFRIVLDGTGSGKLLLAVTEHAQEISDAITSKMGRGVSILPVKGGYTGKEKNMVVCAVKKNEVPQLTKIIRQIDTDTFIIITEAGEILGEGFIAPGVN